MSASGPPSIDGYVLADHPETILARVALGLTLYLTDMRTWAREGAARALEIFLRYAPREALRFYTTSQMPTWKAASETTHEEIVKAISTPWIAGDLRHLLTFWLVDDPGVPSAGFIYREVDPARAARSGSLEITLYQETSPEVLLRLAQELAACGPFFSGVGGYVARWNPSHRDDAFDCVHEWCQRYWGLDVQDDEAFSWLAPRHLPGSNWLTLVGTPLLEKVPGLEVGEQDGVAVTALPNGLLVRAGAEATVGDLNRTELPAAYMAAARRLAPAFPPEPPKLGGDFLRRDDAGRWLRRFVDSQDWTA